MTDDDNDDKADTGASKVGGQKVSMPPHSSFSYVHFYTVAFKPFKSL